MAARKFTGKGLGKGLDALIAPNARTKNIEDKTDDSANKEKLTEENIHGQKSRASTVLSENENEIQNETQNETQNEVQKEDLKVTDSETDNKENNFSTSDEIETNKPDQFLKISEIEPNRDQPRKKFDEDALLELADSIRQYGVLSPIIVQKSGDYYEIIAGERRWRAAKLAGLKEVPVVIREYTEQEIVEISLIENIQRENLNPIEEAQAYSRLMTEFGLKQDELAERVSKSRTAVTNSMRLLKLDERVQEMLVQEQISAGHARALLGMADADQQYMLALRIVSERLSVRDIEKIVKDSTKNKTNVHKKKQTGQYDFLYKDLEERMTGVIGTKVSISQKANHKGKIEISYYSEEELERLTELLLSK